MPAKSKVLIGARRPYNSERRNRQAAETRAQILSAAQDLFAQRGYAATTVEDIAERAGVAAPTVYAAGGKRELLELVIEDVVTAGLATAVGASVDSPRLVDLDDVESLISQHLANVRALKHRGAAAHSVLWRAATSDAQLAAVWRRFVGRLYRGQLDLTARLHEIGALRADLDPAAAADILQAIVRPEAYDAMIMDRGWSLDRWILYVEDAVRRLLLSPG